MKQFVLPFEVESESLHSGETYTLEGRDFHYLIRVRRSKIGDCIPARSRDGRRFFDMEILRIDREKCSVKLHPKDDQLAAHEPRMTLIPSMTKGKKMDVSIRQAVECGTAAIWPFVSRFSQVRFRDDKDTEQKMRRWDRLCLEALQQCGGTAPVEVTIQTDLEAVLQEWGDRGPLFFLHEKKMEETGSRNSLHHHLAETPEEMAIMVGPEGGLSREETDRLLEFGAHPVYLGARVLRAETAVVYGLAAIATIIRERNAWQPA